MSGTCFALKKQGHKITPKVHFRGFGGPDIIMRNLSGIEFRNDFENNFPGDNSGDLTLRKTPGVFYSKA